MEAFSIQNIIDGQAIGITITGMSIVYAGLVLISVYIAMLPVVLNIFTRKAIASEKTVPESIAVARSSEPVIETATTTDDEFNDIASVIGLVLQLEYERMNKIVDNEQITISRNLDRPSVWSNAGKMRKMPQRRTHAKI